MIEFESKKSALVLVYTPRDDDDSWVFDKFDRNEELVLKRTFHLRYEHLISPTKRLAEHEKGGVADLPPLRFKIAELKGEYYEFNADILQVGYPVLVDHDAPLTWKWFTAEQKTSIFRIIGDLRPRRIVVGGPEADAIPVAEFEKLISNFPTSHELKRYVLARVSAVVREFSETEVDGERLFRRYVGRRLQQRTKNILGLFRAGEARKYAYLLDRLKAMLAAEETYKESVWQAEILQIVLLLNPKYIKAIERAPVRDLDHGTTREIDILLVDASGNVDVIEIKQPFDKAIVTAGHYRDNHIPLRELSGSVMQIEKYVYYLNRWSVAGEKVLTEKYADQLPAGFTIKITNPTGIIIMGRDNNLNPRQQRDFEIVKRKYKSIVDIITYDDLVRRLEATVKQLTNT